MIDIIFVIIMILMSLLTLFMIIALILMQYFWYIHPRIKYREGTYIVGTKNKSWQEIEGITGTIKKYKSNYEFIVEFDKPVCDMVTWQIIHKKRAGTNAKPLHTVRVWNDDIRTIKKSEYLARKL